MNTEEKNKINRVGNSIWKEKFESMNSLGIYKIKEKILKKNVDNSSGSILLYRCRSNTLKLGWRIGLEGGETRCGMCPEENEDLVHFLKLCPRLEDIRMNYLNVSSRCLEEILVLKK